MTATPPIDFEDQLNPEQLAAVTHGEGPQLVLAGAGSGKTRVITYRIAWLVRQCGVDPHRIVAVTFTNKAASEMRERVERLLGLHPLPTFVGTFHRYSLILLRRYGDRVGLRRDFAILDSGDQRTLIKQALADEGLSDKSFPPASMHAAISAAKNRLLTHTAYAEAASGFFERRVAQVYRRYQALAQQASGIDFDDMLLYAVRLLEREEEVASRARWRAEHLLVDEYQDTNHAQLRLIELLAGRDGNLTAVGDEDQGIYRWRGAELANILEFEESFPDAEVRKLERNYRSPQNILDASGELVAHNTGRRGKRLWTDAGDGEPIELYRASDEGDEASWAVGRVRALRGEHRLDEMAILVRTNAQTRALEEELLKRQIPYTLVGGVRFYERAEIKDLVAYLRVLRNPRDLYSLKRIINQPPRGIGRVTLERLEEVAGEFGQPLWDVLYQDELGDFSNRAASALRRFRDLVVQLQKLAEAVPLPALLEELLRATGYTDLYNPEDPEGETKLENIREFLSAAQELTEATAYQGQEEDTLTAFLDHAALVSDLDGLTPEGGVSVMTLHSAKGLEFEVVIVTGLEDGLLPHFNARGGEDDVEEERRLLYVGMTRAKERLLLSCCRRRRIAGKYQDQRDSPFLAEIPAKLLQETRSPSLFEERRSQGVYSFFGSGSPPRRATPYPQAQPSAEEDGPPLTRGQRVRHATLGEGTLLAREGTGDTAKLTIFFDRAGKKKLLAKYAQLDPV